MNKAPIHTDTKLSPIENAANDYADKHGFRVPYDGSNKFYDDNDVKWSKEGFIAGATSEAAKAYWLSKQGGEAKCTPGNHELVLIKGKAEWFCWKCKKYEKELTEIKNEYAATVAGEQGKGG